MLIELLPAHEWNYSSDKKIQISKWSATCPWGEGEGGKRDYSWLSMLIDIRRVQQSNLSCGKKNWISKCSWTCPWMGWSDLFLSVSVNWASTYSLMTCSGKKLEYQNVQQHAHERDSGLLLNANVNWASYKWSLNGGRKFFGCHLVNLYPCGW